MPLRCAEGAERLKTLKFKMVSPITAVLEASFISICNRSFGILWGSMGVIVVGPETEEKVGRRLVAMRVEKLLDIEVPCFRPMKRIEHSEALFLKPFSAKFG